MTFCNRCTGLSVLALALGFSIGASAEAPDTALGPPTRCVVIPGDRHNLQFQVDGVVRTQWQFDADFPRPFFYPLLGPSGQSLTRMGHPGAPDHDHHRSVWFAHHKVNGESFWTEHAGTSIRQQQWLALEDGDSSARIAVRLGWFNAAGVQLMSQEMVSELTPLPGGESLLEIQSTFRPADGREQVTLEKTNFGLLAVRVSKTLSAAFGQGTLTSDSGQQGEPEIFGKPHRWVDYSGVTATGSPEQRRWVREGITYFDHPDNPGFPNAWHVRADGWLCASPCFSGDIVVTDEQPLRLRYLLFTHAGGYDQAAATEQFEQFQTRPAFEIRKSSRPHVRFEVVRDG
ncbi:DUF6807 domain-containing protein [Roseimaritima ulvae]|uniref:Methane oxygenase PmoA n=1 Tax=Roseimaritima ulvae TaxID=980254 RepID=A0A5B9QUM0_9BACT|nr:PmoA family protein [Roseimaritima ulvae]QEG41105.1 hypothetical protein UC8_31230 [Roseimaritima ulvae]